MTFYELEKICKRRRFIKRVVLFSIFLVIFVLISILIFKKINNQYLKKEVIKPLGKKELNKSKKIVVEVKEIKVNKTKKVDEPIKKVKENIKFLPQIDLNESLIEKKEVIKKEIKKSPKKEENKTKKIILTSEVLPSFDSCILLAKKYLQNGDYKSAFTWAKNANIQNKKNPLSWIISAKALYKMGKRDEAIKLLKVYNSYYNNKEVKKLLKEWGEK